MFQQLDEATSTYLYINKARFRNDKKSSLNSSTNFTKRPHLMREWEIPYEQ